MLKKLKVALLFTITFCIVFAMCISPTYFGAAYLSAGYIISMIVSIFFAIVFVSDYEG